VEERADKGMDEKEKGKRDVEIGGGIADTAETFDL